MRPKPKTVKQLLEEKRALQLVFSTELQEKLQDDLQLDLTMIEEQKQLEQLTLEKAHQARAEEEKRRAREEYEKEQSRLAEEEARLIQEEKERGNREHMIAEGERLRLQAQQEAFENEKRLEQERIEREHQERLEQQCLAEQALQELEEKKRQAAENFKRKIETPEPIETDPQVEKEIERLQQEM